MSLDSASLAQNLKIRNVRGLLYLSIILNLMNPIFFFLDFNLYPEYAYDFMPIRIFIQACALSFMAASIWLPAFVERHDQVLVVMFGFSVTGSVQAMIFLADGYSSPYYAGMNLVSIALGAISYLNMRSCIIYSFGVVVPYMAPGLLGWVAIDRPALLMSNLVFMLETLFIFFIAMRFHLEMARKEKAITILQKSLFMARREKDGLFSAQVLADTYYVDRIIGHGGMGEVYSGHHLRTQRQVAIKILHPHLVEQQEVIDRFRREAQIAGKLMSENIVEVIDVDEQAGQPFIVMELLLGENLGTYIQRKAPLSLEETANLVQQIASGLAVAHEAHVVHRDLKPTNVFLQRIGERINVKLVDFGISKIQGATAALTQQCNLLGTPSFMSPEQATNKETDERTDIFSLGALSYSMLTGQTPFFGDSVPGVLYAVCQAQPVPMAEYRDDITPELESVIALSLAKKPSERYQTVSEFARDFVAAVSGKLDQVVLTRAKRVNWGNFQLVAGADKGDFSKLDQTENATVEENFSQETERPSA